MYLLQRYDSESPVEAPLLMLFAHQRVFPRFHELNVSHLMNVDRSYGYETSMPEVVQVRLSA